MTDTDIQLRSELQRGQKVAETGHVAAFDAVWSRAEAQVRKRRRRTQAIGGIAAAAALMAVVFVSQTRPVSEDWQFVDPDEFANSTSWVAPSDVLLPEHLFDIYGEIPVLIESTETDGGTLL